MPSARAISMMDVHMSALLLRQMLAEESEHLAPTVHRLVGPVERPMPIEEAVAGTGVAGEFVRLAVLLDLGLVLVDLLGPGRAVVVPAQPEQQAGRGRGHDDRRDARLR